MGGGQSSGTMTELKVLEGETEAQTEDIPAPGCTTKKWQSWDLNPDSAEPRAHIFPFIFPSLTPSLLFVSFLLSCIGYCQIAIFRAAHFTLPLAPLGSPSLDPHLSLATHGVGKPLGIRLPR